MFVLCVDMHCFFLLSSFTIILMGTSELVASLGLSSWCLVAVLCLFLVCHWSQCSMWLWYFLIILTYIFACFVNTVDPYRLASNEAT